MSKQTVMIVDDIESNRVLLKMLLEDYDIVEADSGKACLASLEDGVPDIFLLDINMPEMTGYELCMELRQREQTKTTPIIFVSAMDTTEERLAGFEAGGDDFVTKPIEPPVLKDKIGYCLGRHGEVKAARKNAEEAMQVAMEAMTASSELGQLIQFVKSSQEETTLHGIGARICDVVDSFGLTGCAVIFGDRPYFVNCEADSVEARVLMSARGSRERIISIGVRTIICSDYLALLVKDMPIADDSRYGRFKDHLVVLSSICDGRLLTIQSQMELSKQRQSVLGRVIAMTENQVQQLGTKLTNYDQSIRSVMMSMIAEMEAKLFSLGLDEDQEEALVKMAYDATERMEALKGETKELEKDLGVVLEGLYEILNNNQ